MPAQIDPLGPITTGQRPRTQPVTVMNGLGFIATRGSSTQFQEDALGNRTTYKWSVPVEGPKSRVAGPAR